MGCKLRLAGIAANSVVDGPGLRYTVFVQGCPHHCPGCHNPETHDPLGGYTADSGDLIIALREDPLISGLTLSGGEPFCQAAGLLPLALAAREAGLHVMAYSGYTLEQLQDLARRLPAVNQLLQLIDTLVDGPYIQQLRSAELPFRGSSNQRLIDMRQIRLKPD